MILPLIEKARQDGITFLLTTQAGEYSPEVSPASLSPTPLEAPAPGEQYRFHFDMTKCIGCKCCVVACNEQNGNPAAINWRRVGEIEGGWYPETSRLYLSMGCNHCLEPTCMLGCPTEAYTKDEATGIVLHNAQACIGCQYCTWNCSYGVPQYNPERGVVGKCDMCYGRLAEGREPACVNACPEQAIRIETVNIADWKLEYALGANAPGLPSAADSISTTRLTLPRKLPPNTSRVDQHRLNPESPHWPLVFMTVLTQLSAGAFAAIWFCGMFSSAPSLTASAVSSLFVAALALGASTLHLGRPIHAWRALKMWRRSWLSREVLAFSVFSLVAGAYAADLWLHGPAAREIGLVTALLGLLGVGSSAFIYLVPARPAWQTQHTPAEFFLTGATLGPLFVAAAVGGEVRWLLLVAAAAATGQLLNQAIRLFAMVRSDCFELQASAQLLSGKLRNLFLCRGALLVGGGMVLPLLVSSRAGASAALLLALGAEILGRYLFFVSVVPKSMAGPYHITEAA